MGIPIDFTIIFMLISLVLLLITIMFLFLDPDFNKAIAALILCAINIIFSYAAAYSFIIVSIYGFDSSGVLVENNMYELFPFAMIFVVFVYISLILSFYAIYLCYKKPWEEVLKSYGMRPMWYEK